MLRTLWYLAAGCAPRLVQETVLTEEDSNRFHALGSNTQWDQPKELEERWPGQPTLSDFPALSSLVGERERSQRLAPVATGKVISLDRARNTRNKGKARRRAA